jgi:hypothetical protein
MNNRRKFLTAGGALAAAMAIQPDAKADQPAVSFYIHGIVWNRQLPTPMNDWLIRLDAKADIPIGNSPGFATLGDDFTDAAASHIQIQSVMLNGSKLALTGFINESRTASLAGQPVRIEGRVDGTSVDQLTVTVGAAIFSGAGQVQKTLTPGGRSLSFFPIQEAFYEE